MIIALFGFWITISNVKRSRHAAKQAEKAAKQALGSVRHIDTVQNLSNAITIAQEIRRLNRTSDWKVIVDRHSTLRILLIEVRGAAPSLDSEQKVNIVAPINHSQAMSHKIEVALAKGEDPGGTPRMNRILSEQEGKLGDILVRLRMETEG